MFKVGNQNRAKTLLPTENIYVLGAERAKLAFPVLPGGHTSYANWTPEQGNTHILQDFQLSCFGTSVAVLYQPFGSGQWSFLLCLPLLWWAQGSQMRFLLDELEAVFQQYIRDTHRL